MTRSPRSRTIAFDTGGPLSAGHSTEAIAASPRRRKPPPRATPLLGGAEDGRFLVRHVGLRWASARSCVSRPAGLFEGGVDRASCVFERTLAGERPASAVGCRRHPRQQAGRLYFLPVIEIIHAVAGAVGPGQVARSVVNVVAADHHRAAAILSTDGEW